jgi:hypothetical protein
MGALLRGGAERGRGVQPVRGAGRRGRHGGDNLENLDYFVDWNRREPFQVVRGEGECAV